MVHKKEKLTQKEKRVQAAFLANLKFAKRKTKKPVMIAMIGLVGSGKSSVAKELASLIGANVISGDAIRLLLRKKGEKYERIWQIAENISLEILKKNGNVIMDSDFVDAKKRVRLIAKAKSVKTKLVFVCVYSEDEKGLLDVMIGRNITMKPDEFFGEASTAWKGSVQEKAAVVKLREMIRRLPHHYRWENKGGGRWIIKKPSCKVLADINTANPNWKKEAKKSAQKLLK